MDPDKIFGKVRLEMTEDEEVAPWVRKMFKKEEKENKEKLLMNKSL